MDPHKILSFFGVYSIYPYRRFSMAKLYTDIDQLLEETAEIAEEASCLTIHQIEIDFLLDSTRDW